MISAASTVYGIYSKNCYFSVCVKNHLKFSFENCVTEFYFYIKISMEIYGKGLLHSYQQISLY